MMSFTLNLAMWPELKLRTISCSRRLTAEVSRRTQIAPDTSPCLLTGIVVIDTLRSPTSSIVWLLTPEDKVSWMVLRPMTSPRGFP